MTKDKLVFVLERIDKRLDDAGDSRKKIHEKIEVINNTICYFKPQFEDVKNNIIKLEMKIDENITKTKINSEWIEKYDNKKKQLSRIEKIFWYGLTLIIAQYILQALKLWNP